MSKEHFVGSISVDAGLCWIGDPCYIHKDDDSKTPKSWGKTWNDFVDSYYDDVLGTNQTKAFDHDNNIGGLGVCVSTGYGDGIYPVYVEYNEEGRVKSVTVKFIEERENDE